MLRDPLKFLVFSARAMLITWSSRMFCFQYFSVVQDEPGLYNRIKNLQIGTFSDRFKVLYLLNDKGKFGLSSLIFDNTHFWATLVVFLKP